MAAVKFDARSEYMHIAAAWEPILDTIEGVNGRSHDDPGLAEWLIEQCENVLKAAKQHQKGVKYDNLIQDAVELDKKDTKTLNTK